MKTNTLSFRLFIFTSAWMMASLAIVAILVSQDYRKTVENQFEKLLTANLYNLMGSTTRDQNGVLSGNPQLGDSRYQQFQSGWYWSVGDLSDSEPKLSSKSLDTLDHKFITQTKFGEDFQRVFRMSDNVSNKLMVVEAKVFLGEGDDLFLFRATGNLKTINDEISRFERRLILLLAISGIGLIITSVAIVRFSLKPIRQATSQLAQIRDGRADSIRGEFPQEISPLIEETNALIKSNQSIVERSRTQVGNLAHSLKTPLSVITLEVKKLSKSKASAMQAQLSAMNSQIQSYLNRAMISARHGSITSRTDVKPTLVRLVATFNKLFPDISFSYENAGNESLVFAGEKQDLEEIIGNLLENAGKFAKHTVTISVGKIENSLFEIIITDDGPGLSLQEIDYVLKRGNRLDESQPGTGLGLSIVKDILSEYQGNLQINSTQSNGLSVSVNLPVG